MDLSQMSAAHLIFIPGTLIIGVVIGWILAQRAQADATAAQQRREAAKRARQEKA